MANPPQPMRRFSIRLRMHGAIGVVLGRFALVGITGVLGGRHLAELKAEFMHHTITAARIAAHSGASNCRF